MKCEHLNFNAQVTVNRIEDKGKFVADIAIFCKDCAMPFRFTGVEAGLSYNFPTVSVDGLELHAPIKPELIKRLATKSTFSIN